MHPTVATDLERSIDVLVERGYLKRSGIGIDLFRSMITDQVEKLEKISPPHWFVASAKGATILENGGFLDFDCKFRLLPEQHRLPMVLMEVKYRNYRAPVFPGPEISIPDVSEVQRCQQQYTEIKKEELLYKLSTSPIERNDPISLDLPGFKNEERRWVARQLFPYGPQNSNKHGL